MCNKPLTEFFSPSLFSPLPQTLTRASCRPLSPAPPSSALSPPPLPPPNTFLLPPGGRQLPALWRLGLRSLLPVSRQQAVHAGEPLQRVHQRSALPSLLPPRSGEVPVLLRQIAPFGPLPRLAERWVVGGGRAAVCRSVGSTCYQLVRRARAPVSEP